MVGFIIGLIIMGLIVGALARLLVPGRDPMSILGTIALGVAGSLIGGFIGEALFDRRGGFILALVTTVALVLILRRTNDRSDSLTH